MKSMPIRVVRVPPPIVVASNPPLVAPGETATEEQRANYARAQDLLRYTLGRFVRDTLLVQPRFSRGYTQIKKAASIERSMNAIATFDLGGVDWELAEEDWKELEDALKNPEYYGMDERGISRVYPGLIILPTTARQLEPFFDAIVNAKIKDAPPE
jgi:hypothetical protein